MKRSLLSGLWANLPASVSLIALAVMIAAALSADLWPLADPNAVDLANKFAGMQAAHPFGTDALGRDILSRLIYGARASLLTTLAAAGATALIGSLYGALACVLGGRMESAMMRLCEAWMSIPSEVLLLTIVGLLGPGVEHIFIACAVAKWPWYARMVRVTAQRIRHCEYMQFARAAGAGPLWLLRRHLLPNITADVTVFATIDAGGVLLLISSLSFLGLGVMPPTAEWGMMLAEAKEVITIYPWQMAAPTAAIIVTVVMLHLIGDAAAAALDAADVQRDREVP